MIPLKLELKNFMAYREADPLDFSGLHVVCLTGDNGAGKSTLLDAMTWALWGSARAKRDDELISQGANEMRVALIFSEGKQVYQVVRTRKIGKPTKGKPPASTGTLDFLIKDRERNNGWTTISETRTSDTQDKIIRTLNLTYDTFVNSAFLKQGRADEFTLKPPAQRKELLGEILNLDVWQDYEARAKERLAAIERDRHKLRLDLQQTEQEMARLPEYERALGEAQAALRESQKALNEADVAMTEIERQRERAKGLRAQLSQGESRLRTLDADLANLNVDREQHTGLLQQYQQALEQRDEIERGFAELEQARALNEALNLKLASMTDLNARKFAAENAIADARRALESERDASRRHAEEVRRLASDQDLAAKLSGVRALIAELADAQQQRDQLVHELSESRERQGEARAQNEVLRREMNEIRARLDALERVGAICPTCGRELSEEDRVHLHLEWEDKGKERGDTHRANEALIKELTESRAVMERQIEEFDRALRTLPGIQREEVALEERLSKANEAAQQLPEAEATLMKIEATLAGENYALDARAALAKVMEELAALGYDAAAHRELRDATLTRLNVFAERKAQLDRAAIAVESEQRALQALALQAETLAQRKATEEKTAEDLRFEIRDCERALQNEAEVTATLERARNTQFAAQRKVGEANQRVQSCLALQGTRDRLVKELAELSRKQSLLDELRLAFSKNGVPAMIIESALPALEASANALLGRMTNGRMNLRFETQRLTQKGETSETLEIRISDELGERAYEMFSGGEAFRIDFAIRIALSKLLAHRVGARLQTLFVDEGFGTQDAQGRERLIEAIRAIEDDFERIVVITHIEELKDVFPARIEVTKTTRGSVARVM